MLVRWKLFVEVVEIVAEQGLGQVSDADEITRQVEAVLAAHPAELATYLGGKATVEQWFFGQVMRTLTQNPHRDQLWHDLTGLVSNDASIGRNYERIAGRLDRECLFGRHSR